MKREFLKETIPEITDDQISKVLAQIGKEKDELQTELTQANENIKTLTTERDGLKTQIKERDKDIKVLRSQVDDNADLQQQLDALQQKYDTDTEALNNQIQSQARDFATEKFMSEYEFSSVYARKAVIADFKEQNFELDDKGAFIGAKEWMAGIQTTSPDAFKKEPEPQPTPDPQPTPQDPAPPKAPSFAHRTEQPPEHLSLMEQMKLANQQKK